MKLTQINLAMPLVALGDVLHQIKVYIRRRDEVLLKAHLGLGLFVRLKNFPQNSAMFFLRRNPMPRRAALQPQHQSVVQFADNELCHNAITMLS